jgi:hypothetical protein
MKPKNAKGKLPAVGDQHSANEGTGESYLLQAMMAEHPKR